jgi:hypothetical protein
LHTATLPSDFPARLLHVPARSAFDGARAQQPTGIENPRGFIIQSHLFAPLARRSQSGRTAVALPNAMMPAITIRPRATTLPFPVHVETADA